MEFVALLLSILILGYWFVRKRFSYWSDRGVPYLQPSFPFGNLWGVGWRVSLGERQKEFYQSLKGKSIIGGVFYYLSPIVIATDLDFLRTMFVKDFNYFQNRGQLINRNDPLSCMLPALKGVEWKNMRAKLSPAFSSGKLKKTHSTFQRVADQFVDHLRPMAESQSEVEMKELFSKFSTDVIGNVVYGLDCNSMKDPNSPFRLHTRKAQEMTVLDFFKSLTLQSCPKLVDLFDVRIIRKDVSDFFLSTVKKTVEYREENNVERDDLMQLLMQIKNHGKFDGDSLELGKLTVEEIAAQSFVFFLAGLATSSATMTFAAYELAKSPEMQNKARDEIQRVLKKHNGIMSYDAVQELTYLTQFVDETLRKYPIAPLIRRVVTERYKVPNSDIILEKETQVMVPVLGIHHDPDIYPDPQKFDPDRFTKENIANRHPLAYIPFGDGPRGCIGIRFGLLQVKIGLAYLLNNFKLLPTDRTPNPMKFKASSAALNFEGGLYLRLESL